VTPKRVQKNPKKVTKEDIKEKSDFSHFQNPPSFKDQTCSPFSKPQNQRAQIKKWCLKTSRTPWKNLNPTLSRLTRLDTVFVSVWTARTEPTSHPHISQLGMKTNGNGRETSSTVSITIFFHREWERDSRKWERERVIRVYENE
jgi:hypothetical protein